MTETATVEPRTLYDEDFHAWIQQQVALLEQGRLDRLDLDNLIEELRCMGISERKAIVSNMIVVLMHLLKVQNQPEKTTGGWLASIREYRRRLRVDFQTSPSLRRHGRQMLADCYLDARDQAADETGLPLSTFPAECPYAFDQVLDADFLPPDGRSPISEGDTP